MDIYSYLKKDHQLVSDLMEQVGKSEAEQREPLFKQIKQELSLHADSEEETFYKAVEDASRTKSAEEKVEHAEEEHDEIREYLDKLSAINYKTEEWVMCFGEFKHAVTHHVKEEEGELFEKAKKYLSDTQAESLAQQMEELKQKLKGKYQEAA
jgi:hemerythrin superfamily protein